MTLQLENIRESSATTATGLLMDSSSNHFVGQEVDEGIPKENFLGPRQAHFFRDRHYCSSIVACSMLMMSIRVTATHMSNVQTAYFSVCGILWPSELLKQPSNKQALIYLLADEMVRAGIHKKSSSCHCWSLWCFPVAKSAFVTSGLCSTFGKVESTESDLV